MKIQLRLAALLLACLSATGATAAGLQIPHSDPLAVDDTLSTGDVLRATLARHPLQVYQEALHAEAQALQSRGQSLVPEPLTLAADILSDAPLDERGALEMQAGLEIPLWRAGEKAAAAGLGGDAAHLAGSADDALRLTTAGAVREQLWDIALMRLRHQLALSNLADAQALVDSVRLRVRLGDLAKADLLLAQSSRLQQQDRLIQAEAELMHARKAYTVLTGLTLIPADFSEPLATVTTVSDTHPLLQEASAKVTRSQRETRLAGLAAKGRPVISVGVRRDRGSSREAYADSLALGLRLPFGGGATVDAAHAGLAREAASALAEREQLRRELEQQLHEAAHQLEISQAQRRLASKRDAISQQQLQMSELAFAQNELDLIDLLKLRTEARQASRANKEAELSYQRAIVRYNQAVGVMP